MSVRQARSGASGVIALCDNTGLAELQ